MCERPEARASEKNVSEEVREDGREVGEVEREIGEESLSRL